MSMTLKPSMANWENKPKPNCGRRLGTRHSWTITVTVLESSLLDNSMTQGFDSSSKLPPIKLIFWPRFSPQAWKSGPGSDHLQDLLCAKFVGPTQAFNMHSVLRLVNLALRQGGPDLKILCCSGHYLILFKRISRPIAFKFKDLQLGVLIGSLD